MATGYTHKIADGISFNEFVMSCARAFGALVTMKDEDADAKIPVFEASSYHVEAIKAAKTGLAKMEAMSESKATTEARKAHKATLDANLVGVRKAEYLKKQYQGMLNHVKNWHPPTTEHQGLKDFMAEQITTSISHDCDTSYYKDPCLLTGKAWKRKQIKRFRWDLDYHTKENAEDIERTSGRNDWVRELQESLK